MNSRLDELQAAILRVKLRHLDADNAERRRQAVSYLEALAGLPVENPAVRDAALHVYHLFVIRTSERDKLLQHLKLNGIVAGIHYAMPAHMMPAFIDGTRLPLTEQIVSEIISLPLYPGLDELSQAQVVSAVGNFFDMHAKQ